jgi:hypothetical protein
MLRMFLAAAWYSPSSPTLWADLIAIGGVIATVLVGRQALSRRKLSCTVVSRSRLMDAPRTIRDSLKLTYQDKILKDPYIAALEIANTGRSAIPTVSFDNGRSLQLDLATEIQTVLSIECEPSSAMTPTIVSNGSAIELQPELIARREVIRISLLTEGNVGAATVSLNPFTDVKVETRDREAIEERRRKVTSLATPLLVAFTIIAIAVAFYLTIRADDTAARSNAVIGSALCESLTEFGETTWLSMELVNRDIIVYRTGDGAIESIKFASAYNADVETFNGIAQFLLADYRSANTAQADRMAARIRQTLIALPKLPKEGTGNIASQNLAEFIAVLNQMSNLNIAVPGCP